MFDSIDAVRDFNTYLKKCKSQKCYVEFNNKSHNDVNVGFFVKQISGMSLYLHRYLYQRII